MDVLRFRVAGADDADSVATLHAQSWRRHYRGAYADAFLDGDVEAERLLVWTRRLSRRDPAALTVVAETNGAIAGFAHTVLDQDPTWGALLDNLHVTMGHQRQGIGTHLMVRSARFVLSRRRGSGLYLWVLEQNVPAQHFYARMGGEPVEASPVPDVGGVPGRLNGEPIGLRYAWRDPNVLVARALAGCPHSR